MHRSVVGAIPASSARLKDEESPAQLQLTEEFGRGMRLGQSRRLIRQYGRTDDQVFPADQFHNAVARRTAGMSIFP